MITHHLQAVHERGEPVSALYAAEAGIYGRFGYGLATRPLRSRRSDGLRRHRLCEQPVSRQGGERLRILIAEGDDGEPARGYALFQRKPSWGDARPDGTVVVRECVARDPAAARSLWGCLVDLDLTARVETWDQALDDPLVHLLVDLRAATPKLADGLWLRIVDVPAALAETSRSRQSRPFWRGNRRVAARVRASSADASGTVADHGAAVVRSAVS